MEAGSLTRWSYWPGGGEGGGCCWLEGSPSPEDGGGEEGSVVVAVGAGWVGSLGVVGVG
jgi:hypothetical protein